MKYIKNYENMTEFNTAEPSGGGEFVMSIEPGVAYIKDAEKVCYNMPELIIDTYQQMDDGELYHWSDFGITEPLFNYWVSLFGDNSEITDIETLNKFKLYVSGYYEREPQLALARKSVESGVIHLHFRTGGGCYAAVGIYQNGTVTNEGQFC